MRLNTHLALAPPPRKKSGEPQPSGRLGPEIRPFTFQPEPGPSPDPVLDVVAEILDRASFTLVDLAVKLHEAGELARKTEET